MQPLQLQRVESKAALMGKHFFCVCVPTGVSCRYNRQGRKAKNRRSRDSYSNRAYSRTQTIRNTGTHNLPLYLTRATSSTNDLSRLVHIGDLSPPQHRTARSSCLWFPAVVLDYSYAHRNHETPYKVAHNCIFCNCPKRDSLALKQCIVLLQRDAVVGHA